MFDDGCSHRQRRWEAERQRNATADTVQNTAGGTADDSDAAETSNEHGRTAREQDGSNVASVTQMACIIACIASSSILPRPLRTGRSMA